MICQQNPNKKTTTKLDFADYLLNYHYIINLKNLLVCIAVSISSAEINKAEVQ